MQHQKGIPVHVNPSELVRKTSLGASLDLCLELGGLEPKQVQVELKLDKAQFSRWKSGQEGVTWARLDAVMDLCGNDAPLLWMNHQRGWDLHSMRRVESETERRLRLAMEENAALRRVLTGGVA